ncbi:MAG: FecR domain-containing protein [Paracoccaceae bacterium]
MRRLTGRCLALVLFFAPLSPAAQTDAGPTEVEAVIEVEVREGDTIRGLSETYLSDPDLWPQILELSGLSSVVEVRPGAVLRIPVGEVQSADAALGQALQAIQGATAEGARLFAPEEIETAIDLHSAALGARSLGAWSRTRSQAGEAEGFANDARDISVAERDRAAEAVLTDRHGEVEGLRPEDSAWSPRAERDVLVEFERIRTLSGSTAQVTFRDFSRIRLNANSNAVIERMRTDPLRRTGSAKVALVEGDFYALLTDTGGRNAFEVEVPGAAAEIASRDFFVSHSEAGSRFANYDTGALRIRTGEESVDLGLNQGAIVSDGAISAAGLTVLKEVALTRPADDGTTYNGSVALAWSALPDAIAYWLEVADDPGFNRMQVSDWGLEAPERQLDGLAPGVYFWRVSALDPTGLPGRRSRERRFRVIEDRTAPFLAVIEPAEGTILRADRVALSGETEPDAELAVDGTELTPSGDGTFRVDLLLAPGENSVSLVAVDPAGNRSERTHRIVFRPDRTAEIRFSDTMVTDDEGRFLTASDQLALAGTTDAEPGSRVRVIDPTGAEAAGTVVGALGEFAVSVPASAEGIAYTLTLIAVSGAEEGRASFVARSDRTMPEIALDVPPPAATSTDFVEIAGTASDAERLTADGAEIPLEGGRFSHILRLAAGTNTLELVATDAVGNVTLRRVTVQLDQSPPEVLETRVARLGEAADAPVEIAVRVEDPSGLRQAAPFRLLIADTERRGHLRYDRANGLYRAVVPAGAGPIVRVDVTIEDYAGNSAALRFN